MTLKQTIKNNQFSFGTWLTLPSPAVAEIMCETGFNWIAIDLEHSCLTTMHAEELIRTIDLKGKSPLVRLSSNDEVLIKRMMDAGAHGIIVPMVKTADDATHAYKAMHYPPVGFRGVGLARAQKYGTNFHGYREWLSTEAVLIVQIEHKDSLANLDAIFSLPYVDSFIIGPYDLSSSLGIPGQFDHPLMVEALSLIQEKAKKHGKTMGIHIVETDEAVLDKKIQEGYRFVAYGVDFRVLESSFAKAQTKLKTYQGK